MAKQKKKSTTFQESMGPLSPMNLTASEPNRKSGGSVRNNRLDLSSLVITNNYNKNDIYTII